MNLSKQSYARPVLTLCYHWWTVLLVNLSNTVIRKAGELVTMSYWWTVLLVDCVTSGLCYWWTVLLVNLSKQSYASLVLVSMLLVDCVTGELK